MARTVPVFAAAMGGCRMGAFLVQIAVAIFAVFVGIAVFSIDRSLRSLVRLQSECLDRLERLLGERDREDS